MHKFLHSFAYFVGCRSHWLVCMSIVCICALQYGVQAVRSVFINSKHFLFNDFQFENVKCLHSAVNRFIFSSNSPPLSLRVSVYLSLHFSISIVLIESCQIDRIWLVMSYLLKSPSNIQLWLVWFPIHFVPLLPYGSSAENCQKLIEYIALNAIQNIIIISNRCWSFIICLHLKAPNHSWQIWIWRDRSTSTKSSWSERLVCVLYWFFFSSCCCCCCCWFLFFIHLVSNYEAYLRKLGTFLTYW